MLFLLALPAIWIAGQWATGSLGPEPLKAAMQATGTWTLRLLLLTLLITPLRTLCDWPRIVYVRRLAGVGTACYAVVHLVLYAVHQNLNLWRVVKEIALRPYLTIGFIALVGMLALAWTSTDYWSRKLGKRWKQLHLFIWPVAMLGLLHFYIQSKADVSEPVLVSGVLAWLLTWRLLPARWRDRSITPFALVPVAGLGGILFEFAWFASATNFPALQVALANFDFSFGPRPAMWAAIGAAGLAVVTSLIRRAPALLRRPSEA